MDMTVILNADPLNVDPTDTVLSTSENGNAVLTEKPRKKTMTSLYLKYFVTAPDGKSRKCNFCGQIYSIATATGNLGRHLANRHPGYDKSREPVAINTPPPSTTVLKRHQVEVKTPKLDLEDLNWLILKWLTSSSLPPSTLDETWLLNSFKFISPSIEIWSNNKFHAVLCEVFRSMQKDIKTTLDQVSSKVAIALEFWTSYEKLYFMNITCHWIDDNWTCQKLLLDVCRIPYPCGGTEIYHALVKVLQMYNIDHKVLACTHDNSQSAIHACHKLKEDMDSHKMGPFCYIPCAALPLNNIIEDSLRTTKPVFSKVREFVIEMNACSTIMEDFMQLTTAYQEGVWKFPLDVSSRWNGHYQMFDIVHKASKSMDAVLQKHEETLGSRMLLNTAEKNAINIMHEYLEPFYKTTNNICSNKLPTIGLVLFFMDHISEMIATCRDSHHYPDWLNTSFDDMSLKAASYNTQVCNPFIYMSVILDPRIKGELIPESLNSQSNLDEARSLFLRNYSATHFSSSNLCDEGGSVSFAEEIARKKRRPSMGSTSTNELSLYLSESPAPIATDVLEWWKMNGSRYPRLSIMARDFLSFKPTSVAPEEVFSSKGDEIEKQRFGLSSNIAQALLCVKSWSESGVQLRCKSTEINYDRFMKLAVESAGKTEKTVLTRSKIE